MQQTIRIMAVLSERMIIIISLLPNTFPSLSPLCAELPVLNVKFAIVVIFGWLKMMVDDTLSLIVMFFKF